MKARRYRLQPYEAADGWRWRLRAPNGRIVADGAEAYASRRNVERAIGRLAEELAIASGTVELELELD